MVQQQNTIKNVIERKKQIHQRYVISIDLVNELLQMGYIHKQEKTAGKLLIEACSKSQERTQDNDSQKLTYIGVKFNFESPLEMAIYIITELPESWAECKRLTKLWEKAETEKDKQNFLPTIDRIYEGTKENRGHYERGNIQVLSYFDNWLKSINKRMKPVTVFDTDAGTLTTYKSQKEFQEVESVSRRKVEKMNKAFAEDEIFWKQKEKNR